MNFQNLPGQLIVLLIGWAFTLYLQYNANRRAEALKRKDKIIDRLDNLSSWVEDEVEKKNFDASRAEEAYTGLMLELELRVNQFNGHVRASIVDIERVGELRGLDFFVASGRDELSYKARALASQIVEEIELGCDDLYFNRSVLGRINNFLYELSGVAFGLLSILIFSLLVWAFSNLSLG
ncbi:hypothetical protein [Pseudomonas lundensis]|uniref:Uncharacterized protein n=1 Tax=Pseudomonas lundensis TaxID=86185 RepID=A0AAX2H8Z8_9PSED|nr:hypothetical protein [Pseudomonas lundensis]SOB52742.1 hypothetical protein PLUA15_240155 [Pseudomonas lundensis]